MGVKDLKSKIENFFNILNEIDKGHTIFSDFVSCDLSLHLPYNWSYVKIYGPSGFELKDYVIKMTKTDGYKSNIKIHYDGINASLTSFGEISYLLDKLL